MTRVCAAFLTTLLCLACGKDRASPPALPEVVVGPSAAPSLDDGEPSASAPVALPSERAATPADLAPAPVARADTNASKRPTAAARDAPVKPQALAASAVAGVPSPAERDGAQGLLLRAQGVACTRLRCPRDNVCCNRCTGSHWRPVEGAEVLQRPDGKVLNLNVKELKECLWQAGQCGCAYDLWVVGEARGDQFVIKEVVEVLRTGRNPAVRDSPPPFSAAGFQTWVQARWRSLDLCLTQQKRRNPALAPGTLAVRIVLTPEGQILDPKVTGNRVGDGALTDCITRTLRRWRVNPAPTAAQSFEVHIPFGTDESRPFVVVL